MIDSTQALRDAIENFIARREPSPTGSGGPPRATRPSCRRWRGGARRASPPPTGAMFPPLRRHVRPMRPERAGKLWLAKLHELTAAAGTSEGDADRTGEAAADAGPVPAPEEQAAGAP